MSFKYKEDDYKKHCTMTPVQRMYKDYVEILDVMESKVETLRETASSIEMERESLISSLGRLKISNDLKRFSDEEKEEIEATAQRLMNRILTVEVNMITPRTEIQKKSLMKVNKVVDDVFIKVKADKQNSKTIIEQYINACHSDSSGPINIKFQTLLLDCAADDQKRVRRRLQSILDTINNSSFPMDID